MTIKPLSTEQCIKKLQSYAKTEVRSWNPFNLFRKRKLKNHTVASELAKILQQTTPSDNDLLKIAGAIDGFEDSNLQHDLLCFLYSNINKGAKPFVAKRKNIGPINKILDDLANKKYRPWWAFFLIELPYYSNSFITNLNWLITTISNLFTNRRKEIKEHLINVYSNDEIANQIISEYNSVGNAEADPQSELNKILELSLEQTADHTQRELIKEIKKIVLTDLPFGQVLISVTGLSSIIVSYLSKEENLTKPKQEQAQEIIYIISKVFLKVNATQLIKSVVPGVPEVIEAVLSVITSESSRNPLHADRKIGRAFASVAGGTVGGAIGTMIPGVGTSIGAYIGAVLSKTAATRFYQVLETWQTAPKGPKSIIPLYPRSFFTVFDNDASNILEPIYVRYLETESESKRLGDEIAKWLSIYNTLLQNSGGSILDEHLEIINEEMKKLQIEFIQLKNSHSAIVQQLYKAQPDNPARVIDYIANVKVCLNPLHKPIAGMLNEYFSPTATPRPAAPSDSYVGILRELPAVPNKMGLPSAVIISDKETNPRDLTKHLFGDAIVTEKQYSELDNRP
jgi:hypothetical protein